MSQFNSNYFSDFQIESVEPKLFSTIRIEPAQWWKREKKEGKKEEPGTQSRLKSIFLGKFVFAEETRIGSGCRRVASGGCGAKEPSLAARLDIWGVIDRQC